MATSKVAARSPEVLAIDAAKKIIKDRLPLHKKGTATFRLLNSLSFLISPKFYFRDSEGKRVLVRYTRQSNSIFAEQQDDVDGEIELRRISLKESTLIDDPNLRDFLLLHPWYGKYWELVDKQKDAKLELDRIERFDEIYGKVRKDLSEEQLKSLYMLLIPETQPQSVSSMTTPELRIGIRKIAENKPEKVEKAMASPLLKTLYVYHMAEALKVLAFDPQSGVVKWVESDKELCKVPVDKDPAMYVAQLLTMDEHVSALERINKELYD